MRRTLFIAAWLLFVLLLLEGAGFVFYQLEVSKPISGYGYPAALTVAHPQLEYLYQPNFSGHFNGSAYQHIPIRINAQGFRDDDFRDDDRPGVRIAVLGDSVVFGPGVSQDERFTECLQGSPRGQAEGWRILNMGVNAYSFGHYLALARLDFLDTRPHAVLVGITLNDFAPMGSSGPTRRLQRHAEQLHKPDWVARIQERIDRTYAVRFITEIKTRFSYAMMNADDRSAYHTQWMRTVLTGWGKEENQQRFTRQLKEFQETLEQHGTPYGFILFPELNDLQHPEEFASARTTVKAILERQKLPYCDPYATFAEERDLASLFLERDSIHYNAAGHRLLCKAVERCLTQGTLSTLLAR